MIKYFRKQSIHRIIEHSIEFSMNVSIVRFEGLHEKFRPLASDHLHVYHYITYGDCDHVYYQR